jgi:glycosyltransferase involved in cell wall biosynthesis
VKILFIVPSYKPAYVYGGPIRSVGALCEALVSSGHQVTVYTTNANGKQNLNIEVATEVLIDGVRVYYFKRWTKDHSNFSPGLLVKVIRTVPDFDIVHIQSWWNAVTMPSAFISLIRGRKPIISPRGSITSYTFNYRNTLSKSLLHKLGGKALLKRSAFLATSTEEERELKTWVDEKIEVSIIPNILDLPDRLLGTHTDTEEFKLIFLSRIDPKKNLELLLRIIPFIQRLKISLTILGEGIEEYVSRLQSDSGNIPNISWKGNIDGDEKFRLLAEADLFVLPSHSENYGNVVFEALSQGTPVAISDAVGAKDYVTANQLGWVIAVDDESWKKAIVEIWQQKAERDDIRRRAPICIARDFLPEVQVQRYVGFYAAHLESAKQ